MDTLKDFFERMHSVDFTYVVLRNFENLPNDVCLGDHSDLDLMCYDYDHFMEIFPMAVAEYSRPRVRVKIPVGDSFFYCDVRSVDDGYYPSDFSNDILKQREWNERGFYTPCYMHHAIALSYHVVHHKNRISENYMRYLGDATIEELYDALKESPVGWVRPDDHTVGAFNPYWKGATSVVEKKDGFIFKRQTSFTSYNLIEQEYKILSRSDSKHFPKVYGLTDGVIKMEDCGVPILIAIPDDWESQLAKILEHLLGHNIIHRDIRLDNLMVKDGIIKLIDFGWAKYMDEEDKIEPPSCLGYPNRPSDGWSDRFSIRSVSKQIAYHLEESK